MDAGQKEILDIFTRTRALLDKSFATLSLVDKSAVLDERATLLGRGEAIVASISSAALRATITKEPLFYRMWKPDEKGTPQEVGYVIIRVREGQRGEVDGSADPRALKGLEAEKGLLATVDARVASRAPCASPSRARRRTPRHE